MSIWGIVLGVLLAIVSVAIIVVIILQEGNQQGIGAVTGAFKVRYTVSILT